MSRRVFPEHIGPARPFRQQKRREMRKVLAAEQEARDA